MPNRSKTPAKGAAALPWATAPFAPVKPGLNPALEKAAKPPKLAKRAMKQPALPRRKAQGK